MVAEHMAAEDIAVAGNVAAYNKDKRQAAPQ
jgi:hypothetical protein